MRKETSNQFTEGLVSDLNPITTPNTVLTDNLNGTIITYNGNEFSLQNDQGNYELKHCRLKPNYIPVGIKEYGDILYIVSYNPITEKVQIGSYPSPLTYETSENDPGDRIVESAIQKLWESREADEDRIKYTDITKELDSIIFNEERFKLNPGDQYRLLTEDEWDYHFENIDYKILNESSYHQNITDLIKLNQDDYEHVAWTTPGYLVINSKLADIKIHSLNTKYFYIHEDESENKYFKFSFTTKLNVEDPHLKNDIKNWINRIDSNESSFQKITFDFIIYEKYESEGDVIKNELFRQNVGFFEEDRYKEENYNVESGKFGYSEWYNDYVYLWKNIRGEFKTSDFDRTIIVEITPVFYDKNDIKIEFDNLFQQLEFNLTEAENGTYKLGDDIFKFKVDLDKKQEIIAFNTKSPLITDGQPTLYYRLYSFYSKQESDWKLLIDEFGYQDELECVIDLDESTLDVEDAGYIEFSIETNVGRKSLGKRLIITSEYLNDFYEDRNKSVFDRDIYLTEWMRKHFDKCELEYKLTAESCEEKVGFNEDVKKFYSESFGASFFPIENNLQPHFYNKGYKYTVHDLKSIGLEKNGRLWNREMSSSYIYSDIEGNKTSKNSLYNIKRLVCKFISKDERIECYPGVEFVELKPEKDTLIFGVSGTQIQIGYNGKEYSKVLTVDDDNYPGPGRESLEDYIWEKGLYGHVGRYTEGGADLNEYSEPQILSRYIPCRLLEVTINTTLSNKCITRFGVIKPSNKAGGPYDMDTSRLNYSPNESGTKTFYFLMVWSGETLKVDNGKRYTGRYVLVPFDEGINKDGFEYYKNFCKKLIQPRSNTNNIEKTPCYCYKIEFEIEDIKYNTITSNWNYNLGINKDLDNADIMYKNILDVDKTEGIVPEITETIKYSFSKDFNIEFSDSLDNINFSEEKNKIDELNKNAETQYNSWLSNPIDDHGKIERDKWICLDKNLKNDQLKFALTEKIDREYLNNGNLISKNYPDRVQLKASENSWMCARIEEGDDRINEGNTNFVTFGTVWDEPDNSSYTIDINNWLN